MDIGIPGLDDPFWIATSDPRFNEDYRANRFMHVDPVIPVVRRTNRPFLWGAVPLPKRAGKRKPAGLKVVEAARDYGLLDGLVIPFHFVDSLGRLNEASCALHWPEKRSLATRLKPVDRTCLQVVMIYWAQRVMEIATRTLGRRVRQDSSFPPPDVGLTDRERAILEWAGRGKTAPETADILNITVNTVNTHIENALRKLNAVTKTQAVVLAIKGGLIDP